MLVLCNMLIWKLRERIMALLWRLHSFSTILSVFIFQRDQPSFIPGGQFSPQALGNRSSPQAISNPRQAAFEMRMHDRQNSVSTCSKVFTHRGAVIASCAALDTFPSNPLNFLEKQAPENLFSKKVAFSKQFLWDCLNKAVFLIWMFGMILLVT